MTITENDMLFVGIDGGGTKCRVRLETAQGQLLSTGIGGTANPSHGLAIVIESITTALNDALEQAGLAQNNFANMVVGAGLAGLHLPKYHELMASWQHPFKAFYLTDDLHAATIGAHDGKDGAIAIIGTGFSALSVVNNHSVPIGGYGFLQADKCSGSWIGYQAVQAVLLAHDHLAPPTQLTQLLLEQLDAQGVLLADKLVGASARDYGALAPLVFQAAKNNDGVAEEILAQSCHFISQVITLLSATNPPRISLIGGVAEQLIKQLAPKIANKISPAIHSPEVGALHFAHQQHKN